MKLLRSGLIIAAALGFSHSAIAADMSVKAPRVAAAPAPAWSWAGFYAGGHLGGGWIDGTGTWNPLPSPAAFGNGSVSGSFDSGGFVGGAHIGYNWVLAPNWVVGIEGDWTWSGIESSFTAVAPLAGAGVFRSTDVLSQDISWLASIRGRIGTTMWNPMLLVYFTGGVAWADIDYRGTSNIAATTYASATSFSSTVNGFVLGGGAEWAWTPRWLVRVEYLFYGLDSAQSVVAPAAPPFAAFPSNFVWSDVDLHVVRAGLSYKF